jgi:hypothetical protein
MSPDTVPLPTSPETAPSRERPSLSPVVWVSLLFLIVTVILWLFI